MKLNLETVHGNFKPEVDLVLACVRERNLGLYRKLLEDICRRQDLAFFATHLPYILTKDIEARSGWKQKRCLLLLEAPIRVPSGTDYLNIISSVREHVARVHPVLILPENSYSQPRYGIQPLPAGEQVNQIYINSSPEISILSMRLDLYEIHIHQILGELLS